MEFLTDLERVILDKDLVKWKRLLDQVRLLAPSGSLLKGPSISQHHLIDSCSSLLEGLSADEVPRADSGYLYLLMQRLMHLTARYFLDGGDDGFNSSFCHGYSHTVRPGAEQSEFDLFVETIFLPRERLAGPLRFLANPDTNHSFVRSDRLKILLQTEEETGLLRRLIHDLGSSSKNLERIHAKEVEKMLRFLYLLDADNLALYYWEYAT